MIFPAVSTISFIIPIVSLSNGALLFSYIAIIFNTVTNIFLKFSSSILEIVSFMRLFISAKLILFSKSVGTFFVIFFINSKSSASFNLLIGVVSLGSSFLKALGSSDTNLYAFS